MKYLLILLLPLFISSCEDEPIPISYGPPNVTGDRKVIAEEFTGVICVNCPLGSDELKSLSAFYPGKVITIGVHSGFFATPHKDSKYDFRTPDGDYIFNLLGPANFYPSATFNRRNFNGSDLIYKQESWAGLVQEIVNGTAEAGLDLQISYNPDTRQLNAQVSGVAKKAVESPLYIHLLVTESKIIDWQKYPNAEGHITDYEHNHVLRKLITPFAGDKIKDSFTSGETFEKNYSYQLPNQWVAGNCSIVAYVSYANKGEILQADEENLAD